MDQSNWLKDACIPEPIADSGWTMSGTSRPERGIRDYKRIMTFEYELSIEDVELVCALLQESKDCPGWTGVSCRTYNKPTDKPTEYIFYTTWDSSD